MRNQLLIALAASALLSLPARADVKIDEPTKKAIDRGLEWLAKRQNQDGSYSDGQYQHNSAITSFAMLAFMSQGHLPNQGLYGPEVAKASRFLVASAKKSTKKDKTGKDKKYSLLVGARATGHMIMYGHGMATLALAELYGQTGDDSLKEVVREAVDLIIDSQVPPEGQPMHRGGWRYDPAPTGADISVTIMQIMALRAAKNAGLHVPDSTLKNAIAYVKSCYNRQDGGFSYQPGGRAPGFARTAAGMCVLFLTGEYTAKEIPEAVKYLKRNFDSTVHFYYGHYYASHAMHQVGGKEWEEWYTRLVKYFVPSQSTDGSWTTTNRREVGPVYQTSIAVIALSVPAHYLPIFQR